MELNQEFGSPLPTVEMEETCKMPKCQNLAFMNRLTAANGGKQLLTSEKAMPTSENRWAKL
jgi:hypothetical protein